MSVDFVDGDGTGVYRVTTASGSVYIVNLDERYTVRSGDAPMGGITDIPNDERYYYSYLSHIEVGEALYQERVYPGSDSWRWRRSTPITKIEEITNDIQSA